MSKAIAYPTLEKITEFNILALNILKVKKADKSQVLSMAKITDAIEKCRNYEGDIYDKAVILLKGIVQNHPFASGNRRTALIAVKDFVINNNQKFEIKDDPKYAKVMQGVREDYYTHEEIKEWMKNGEIREFKR
ncbi:type II toxin-antitoxin system death-on-curing family toxin [Candidatus Woesearchaeota archaeon]|nr:type II toxin-antitoxin system death-on-curing family toxin [Candidatus Woesearchaeota archaeon]MBI2660649.1 type II toxin-antitoxin system death-on-curing family toxin [Candidatus Woesearchaeota archaeon]